MPFPNSGGLPLDGHDRVVFLHIPKCAGTAFKYYFGAEIGRNQVYEVRDPDEIAHGLAKTNDRKFIIGHFGYRFIEQLEGDPFTLAFLRDPVERTLSHYYYWHELPSEEPGPSRTKELGLLEFLRSDFAPIRIQIENLQAWMLAADYRGPSRSRYRNLSDSALFDLAIEHLQGLDFLGFTETFNASYNALCRRFGRREPRATPFINQTKSRAPASAVGENELAAIHELTAVDRRVYDYAQTHLSCPEPRG